MYVLPHIPITTQKDVLRHNKPFTRRRNPMARPKKNDLVEYNDYLAAQGVGVSTARTYVSHVRKVLRSVHTLNEPSLTEFLYSSVSGASRSTVRAAWKYFRRFVHTTLSQDVPDFGTLAPGAVRDAEAAFNPPPDLATAITAVINVAKVTPTMLSAATWRSVTLTASSGKPSVYLNVREGRITGAIFPKQYLLPMLAWAAPDTKTPLKSQPLIPLEAGGNTAATALQLRRLAARALDASKMFRIQEGLTEEDEGAEVFDLETEEARSAGEQTPEPIDPRAPAWTRVADEALAPAPPPVEVEAPYNQSRFAPQSTPDDRPMSTSELMDFIARSRQ